jgi:L-ascorbate metabolism protein UlaG (beta-lactamase superfamily)
MQIKSKAIAITILALSLLISACGPEQVFDPVITPTLTIPSTSIPTMVHQATQTTKITITPTAIPATPISAVQATPDDNALQINKYPGNNTCFKLVTSHGVIIITDPYGMNEDVQPDIVTISHDHGDHRDFSHIAGEYQVINTAGIFDEKGIEIIGVAGHHNRDDKTMTNIIYVFDLDGLRLAQFASQGEMPTEDMFNQIGEVDILIIQIYGTANWKLSTEEASLIAKRLQAKIVIPAHTDTSQNEPLAALLGVKAEEIVTGKLIVTKAGLAEQQTPRVVVLDSP